MTEPEHGEHPDLERLAEHAVGRLPASEAAAVAEHLRACPLCSLERRRLARFAGIDDDAEALAAAEWPRAELLLQRAFSERVRPAITNGRAGAGAPITAPARPGTRRRGLPPRRRWLTAGAAAAALLLFFIADVARPPRSPLPASGPDLLRGGGDGSLGASVAGITLLAPLGEIAAAPRAFRWRAERPGETFTLTLFTPELTTLLRRDGLTESLCAVPDSVRERLVPGTVYVWSVQGRAGLTPSAASPSGWFRIVKR